MAAQLFLGLSGESSEKASFEPGDDITGTAELRLLKPRSLKSIVVKIIGETILRRTKRLQEMDEIRAERYRHLEMPLNLLELEENNSSEDFSVGNYTFPFQFRIPDDCPGNMVSSSQTKNYDDEKPKYEIHYWIEAESRALKRNHESCAPWFKNHESTHKITAKPLKLILTETVRLDMFPSTYAKAYFRQIDLENEFNNKDQDEGRHLRCIVSTKRRYFARGDAILVSVRFYNKTSRLHQGFLIDLVKSEDYNVRDNSRDHPKHKDVVIAHRFVDKQIEANTNTFLVGSIMVPDGATPTTSSGGGSSHRRRVKISYSLEVRMAYGKQLDRVPILILTKSCARSISLTEGGNMWRQIARVLSSSTSTPVSQSEASDLGSNHASLAVSQSEVSEDNLSEQFSETLSTTTTDNDYSTSTTATNETAAAGITSSTREIQNYFAENFKNQCEYAINNNSPTFPSVSVTNNTASVSDGFSMPEKRKYEIVYANSSPLSQCGNLSSVDCSGASSKCSNSSQTTSSYSSSTSYSISSGSSGTNYNYTSSNGFSTSSSVSGASDDVTSDVNRYDVSRSEVSRNEVSRPKVSLLSHQDSVFERDEDEQDMKPLGTELLLNQTVGRPDFPTCIQLTTSEIHL